MKITLLGAGHIGSTIARLLQATGDYDVLLADRNAQSLLDLAIPGIKTAIIDSSNPEALHDLIKSRDAVINALPYQMAIPVAQAAKSAGTHCFDLTEDVHATKLIRSLAQGANTAFMPQCGLAPGFISIATYALSQRFDQVFDIKMRVGALPEFPTNALKYNPTWSLDGLVNEYIRPCEAILAGQLREVQPLEGLEHFSIDGIEYEAFNTSGGLGTLCETLAGKVRNLDYKTVRYPGHCALMRFLLADLGLASQPEQLKSILRAAIPETEQDLVLIFIMVSGLRQGKLVQDVFSRKIFASQLSGRPGSAIQIATASGICAALDLFREERLPQAGFITQESIDLNDFLHNRFGRVYNLNTTPSAHTDAGHKANNIGCKTDGNNAYTPTSDDQTLASAYE
ncbi:saccharopine dehydrogenase NADP-binding domain-containing protein [Alcaligenaceae bacterium]|nr:saccharopine dehydrogenase NADP-binding domain-containing protein [Alcaligenaceae bacterium]